MSYSHDIIIIGLNIPKNVNGHLFNTHIICQFKSIDGWSFEEVDLICNFYYKHEAGNSIKKFEVTSKRGVGRIGVQRGGQGNRGGYYKGPNPPNVGIFCSSPTFEITGSFLICSCVYTYS